MTDPQFSTAAMRAVFSPQTRVQRMLDVEAALARVQGRLALIPPAAAAVIASHCDAAAYDLNALVAASREAGNPAIPLVAALTAQVGAASADAARYVHWGATSQDIIDTGLVLQLRDALALIEADLVRLCSALAGQTREHAATPMAARTLLQQALPTTFGLKLAGLLDACMRHRQRLHHVRGVALVAQCAGAAGTLAAMGERALDVADALAVELDLAAADVGWHTQRDRLCEVAAMLGMLIGTVGKLARDLSLLMQNEVAEVFEPAAPGRGGSSTLPHKRNPVGCAIALAAATRAPGLVATLLSAAVQEHERGLGNWPAEWDTLPDLCELAAGSLAAMADVVAGLVVDSQRMRKNLDASNGLIYAEQVQMALATALGRAAAHDVVKAACARAIERKLHLRDVLADSQAVVQVLGGDALAKLFEPESAIGAAAALVARVLARYDAETALAGQPVPASRRR